MKKSLTKAEILRGHRAIRAAFRSPNAASGRGLKVLWKPNGRDYNRILIVPVRKYGSAVARNRAKRLVREVYREIKEHVCVGYDLVFIVYPGFDQAYSIRFGQIRYVLQKAELYRNTI
ncbi:MAG: ribonuclease P protein component [Spirochaetaceae bacterium]|nr:MAG: ribonuclease P protein component [Spirochaetaceae bacterium]